MKKALVVGLMVLAVGCAGFAKVTLMPGIAFVGSTVPAISFGTLIESDSHTFGVNLFAGYDYFIITLRQYPWEFQFEDFSVPVFLGIGGVTASGEDGQFLAGLYAESGIRLMHFMSVNFSITHFGYVRSVNLGVEVHFALSISSGD